MSKHLVILDILLCHLHEATHLMSLELAHALVDPDLLSLQIPNKLS